MNIKLKACLFLTISINPLLEVMAQKSEAPLNSVVIDKIIAKVDNQILLKSEYDILYLQSLADSKKNRTNVDPCKVIETLLTNKLLLAKADMDSVNVDDKTIEGELDRRMEYFIGQIGSKEKLEAYYKKSITDLKNDMRRQVKEQLVSQKIQGNISGKVKISPGEVKKFYDLIPADSLPFFSKEVEIAQIVIYPKVGSSQKKIVRQRLQDIKARIENGENFEAIAKEISEDPVSARDGGQLGFFKKGELVPEYEAASLKMKPNELSEIIESQFGFHLIKLVEIRGNEYNTKHILLKPGSSSTDQISTYKFIDSIRTKIVNDSLTFGKAAKKYSDDKATKDNNGLILDQQSGSSKIATENIPTDLFFVVDSLKPGDISKPTYFKDEEGKEAIRIVYFKSSTEPHQANLNDDFTKIQFAALQEKKNRAINEWFLKSKKDVFIDLGSEFKSCDLFKENNF